MILHHVGINAHLLSAQAGYRSAGIHGYIYHTLHALPNASDSAWAYTVFVGEGHPPAHNRLKVERSKFSTSRPLQRIIWEQVFQPSAIQKANLDLYHGMAFVAPLRLKIPSVVTVYDLTFMRYPQALSQARRLYLKTFTQQSCERAAQVITISESTARDVVELMGISPEKIVVAVPGVSSEFAPLPPEQVAEFRQKLRLPERFILHVGTLEPRKNLVMLLKAYAQLPDTLQKSVHLVLAGGKGWDYDDIFKTVEAYRLGERVHFPGFVKNEDLPFWYNAAEILVYPSLFEGWGLPVVEAMACGCPTLISDISSLPEAAGETGLRLPSTDVSAWTDGLQKAITDDTWRKNSQLAGIERARQFTWQATASATLQAYRQALR